MSRKKSTTITKRSSLPKKQDGPKTALSILKAGLAGVRVVGGPLASLIDDCIQSATQESIELTVRILKKRLDRYHKRLDVSKVDRIEFAELFKSCYLVIVRSHKKARLEAAANLLVHVLLKSGDKDELLFSELDFFVRVLDSISLGAIEILALIYDIQTGPGNRDVFADNTRLKFGRLHAKYSGKDAHLLMGLVGELDAYNLVHLPGGPAAREPDYANYTIELTPLGARFVVQVIRWGADTEEP